MIKLTNYFYQIPDKFDYIVILFLTFLATSIFVGAIYLLIVNRDVASKRLSKLLSFKTRGQVNKLKLFEEESNGWVAKISKPLYKVTAPANETIKNQLRLKMTRAGLRSKQALYNYRAAKLLLAMLLPSLYLVKSSFYTITTTSIAICFFLATIGYFLPNIFILQLTQKRQEGMRKSLPDALDLMVICVQAGLGLDMTFKRVGDEIRSLNKNLSDEFYLTTLEIKAGKQRDESFNNMALRTGLPEIKNLMTILNQTNRFGTSITKALQIHAEGMRVKRQQLAEESAAKAAVKLIFPLILFILPSLFTVIMGPAVIIILKNLILTGPAG